jgi:hypothetical protein
MPGITTGLDQGFYQGGGLSDLVPALYPVAIDGRPYLIDLKSGAFKRQTIPVLRQQADNSNLPGESSINPEDLWRRAQETWHHGAGQKFLDRDQADSSRFNQSKGIDVWEKWQLTLLNDTERKVPSTANVNQHVLAVGTRLYWADGATLRYTTDPTVTSPTWVAVTGLNTNPIEGLATDGYNVYISQGSQGIYKTDRSTSVAASWATGNAGVVAYVRGRIMVALANALANPTATGALTAFYTQPNTDFRWVGFAEGQGQIYAAGFSGDKSIIYRTAVRQDGTALDVPVVAAELPDGEIVRAIQGYLGFVVVGTDRGVRFATTDGQGNLTLGSIIAVPPVYCFEPQDRFVWFGWTNFDALSTGLGRLDLSAFVAPLTPAHASDLMATAQGRVTSVCTFGTRRYFTVSGYGLIGELTTKVTEGFLDSGKMTFGIPDTKVGMFLQVRHQPLSGQLRLEVSVDGGPFVALGANLMQGSTQTIFPLGEMAGETFEFRVRLYGSAALSPIVTRATLRAYPGPARGEIFIVPLILHETIEVDGQERYLDPETELNHIRSVVKDHRLVIYQESKTERAVFVEDYEWTPVSETMDGHFWNGVCVVKLKAVSEY